MLPTAAPQGVSLGEWLAIISCVILVGGIIYRTALTAGRVEAVEQRLCDKHDQLADRVEEKLTTIALGMAKLGEFIEGSHLLRVDWSAWRAETDRSVKELLCDVDIIRDRAHDTNDALTPIYIHLNLPLPERRHRDRRTQ